MYFMHEAKTDRKTKFSNWNRRVAGHFRWKHEVFSNGKRCISGATLPPAENPDLQTGSDVFLSLFPVKPTKNPFATSTLSVSSETNRSQYPRFCSTWIIEKKNKKLTKPSSHPPPVAVVWLRFCSRQRPRADRADRVSLDQIEGVRGSATVNYRNFVRARLRGGWPSRGTTEQCTHNSVQDVLYIYIFLV